MRSIRQYMTMRATIEENENKAEPADAYGHPVPASWTVKQAGVPCNVYTRARREAIDGDKSALIEDIRGQFPLDAPLSEHDRLSDVRNRRGELLFDGPLAVDTVQRRRDHLEAMLRRIDSGK